MDMIHEWSMESFGPLQTSMSDDSLTTLGIGWFVSRHMFYMHTLSVYAFVLCSRWVHHVNNGSAGLCTSLELSSTTSLNNKFNGKETGTLKSYSKPCSTPLTINPVGQVIRSTKQETIILN